jgi:hypothetical protein
MKALVRATLADADDAVGARRGAESVETER